MLTLQSIVEKHKVLIQRAFNTYCLKQNIHLSTAPRNILFKKLLLYLQKNLPKSIDAYGDTIPIESLVVELVRLGCKKLFKSNNAEDLELLHTESYKLIVKYQPIIKHIVYKQNAKGESINPDLQSDIIANIQAKLLQKANSGKLAAQYKGNALFSTYFYKAVYNSMIDEWRKLKRLKMNATSNEVDLDTESSSHNIATNIEYNDIVEHHLQRLQSLIQMLSTKRRKRFEFALMIVYKMKLITTDIRNSYPHCSDYLLVEILSYFSKNYHELAHSKLFVLIGDFLSALEESKNPINSDSFRIWFQNILNKIKNTLFENLPNKDKKAIDTYFEFLVYKLYKKK